jgi:hypothetical protein
MGTLTLGALALILALGKYGYLYRLQVYLPFAGLFRDPCRYIVLLHFAMAIAAAIAFVDVSELAQHSDRLTWRKLWPLALLPVASVLVAGFSLWSRTQPDSVLAPHLASTARVLVGPVLVTLATAMVVAALHGVRYALVGISLFAAADQAVYGLSYVWRTPPTDIAAFVDAQPMPPEASAHRVESLNNVLTMRGACLASGYVALFPQRQLDDLRLARLQAAGVGWVEIRQGTSPQLDTLLAQGIYWLQVSEPLARARLVAQARTSTDPNNDIDTIELKSTALVSEALQLAGGPTGEAAVVSDRPGEIQVVTTANSRQLLVLSESYHEGWQARVNGQTRPVLRVYGDFMGCVVDAGRCQVEFSFQPQSLHLGGWLSVLGLALTLLSFAVSLSLHPRRLKHGPESP